VQYPTIDRRDLLKLAALAFGGVAGFGSTLVPRPRPSAGATGPSQTSLLLPFVPQSWTPNPVQLGAGASLGGRRPFPDDNPWNTDISQIPPDSNSDALIASIGLTTGLHPDFGTVWNGAPNGIPYVVVAGSQARVVHQWRPRSSLERRRPLDNSPGDRRQFRGRAAGADRHGVGSFQQNNRET
jgi:hypothetical protein